MSRSDRLLRRIEEGAAAVLGPAAAVSVDRDPSGWFVRIWRKDGTCARATTAQPTRTAALRAGRRLFDGCLTGPAW